VRVVVHLRLLESKLRYFSLVSVFLRLNGMTEEGDEGACDKCVRFSIVLFLRSTFTAGRRSLSSPFPLVSNTSPQPSTYLPRYLIKAI
jgi:hypothetical protein